MCIHRKYESYVHDQNKSTGRRGRQQTKKVMDYIHWLRQQLEKEEMTPFKRLANGPNFDALSYNAYSVNGYVFVTSSSESNSTTQNSGVAVKATGSFRSRASDKNLKEDEVTYYGILKQILELDYYDFKQTVFYCDWVRIEDKVNGCVVDPLSNLIFVNFGRFQKNTSEDDEPFIHASQAYQVFYCRDETRDNWHCVLESPKRLGQNVDAYEDPFEFSEVNEVPLLSSTFDNNSENNED